MAGGKPQEPGQGHGSGRLSVERSAAAGLAQEISYESTRIEALELHRSLIGYAEKEVRAKITASAQAAKAYLAECGQKCDLNLFLSNDLKKRFPGLADKALQLLMALIFAETVGDEGQFEKIDLKDTMQKQQQFIKTISNIMKNLHDTLKAILQNIKA